MEREITIAVLLGTVRTNRVSEKVARYVCEVGKNFPGVTVELIDPRDLSFTDEGEEVKDQRYSRLTAHADAFIIVTPEYNHSFPGSLKRMLDSEYTNYHHKPVALVGVSSGSWGGTRVCEALLPVCHRLGMVNIHPELYFPNAQDLFTGDGVLKPEHIERYTDGINKIYAELTWFTKKLMTQDT